jgi:hypothetical protein
MSVTVKQKQCILAWFDCLPPGGIDGIWGPRSAEATQQLQRNLGIADDGIWGAQTDTAVREHIFSGEDLPEAPEKTGTFWDHIRHWTREEWRCQCGGKYCNGFPAEPDQTLAELVDDIRQELGAPGHRSSGLRCEIHNRNEGGVWNSKHLSGKALDFYIEGVSGEKLLAAAQKDPRTNYAYIIGNGPYVHVDVK